MVYRLVVPPTLMGIYNIFNISQLRKYVGKDQWSLDTLDVELDPDLSFEHRPVAIMNQRVKEIKNCVIPFFLVTWDSRSAGESTWEYEDDIQKRYP